MRFIMRKLDLEATARALRLAGIEAHVDYPGDNADRRLRALCIRHNVPWVFENGADDDNTNDG